MKRFSTLVLALALPLLLLSCTEETLISDPAGESYSDVHVESDYDKQSFPDLHSAMFKFSPEFMLGKRHTPSGTFATPLFGLATAPNDDILVADAGSGIALKNGATDISLPGVTSVGPIGRSSLWATTTGSNPEEDTGQALWRTSQGKSQMIVNIFEVEETLNPDGNDPFDSNPFDVASLGGDAVLVVDAGGNVLYRIDNQGGVEVVAVFPDEVVSTSDLKAVVGCPNPEIGLCFLPDDLPAQSVPTSVAIGPDGYYYVGELKGFPAPLGESRVWKVDPDASWADCGTSPDCEIVLDGGFTSIIDLAFGEDGTLYVAELDEDGWFAIEVLHSGSGGTINACDVSTPSCTEVANGIPMLTAITLDRSDGIWATKNALISGAAEVFQAQ